MSFSSVDIYGQTNIEMKQISLKEEIELVAKLTQKCSQNKKGHESIEKQNW